MRYLKKFNEELGIKDIILTAMLIGVGLSKSDAQVINNDTIKKSIVRQVYNYNQDKIDYQTLKTGLGKLVSNVDVFMKNYLEVTPQRTYIIKANFLPISLDYNSQLKIGSVNANIPLNKLDKKK